jgi:hypothetical protein
MGGTKMLKPAPDGECGAYWADEGGEWMCHRPLGHQGEHSIYRDGQTKSATTTEYLRVQGIGAS